MWRPKLVVFGGAFDPIHQGHVEMMKEAMRQLQADQGLLLPSFAPPHRHLRGSFSERVELCERAFEKEKDISVSRLEEDLHLSRPELAEIYFADVAKVLAVQFPDDERFLLLGEDAYRSLEYWYRREEVLRCFRPVYFRRGSVQGSPPLVEGALALEGEIPPYSSTAIRAALWEGKRPEAAAVPVACQEKLFSFASYRGAGPWAKKDIVPL